MTSFVSLRFALLERLADADDRRQSGGQRGLDLLVDRLVGLAEELPTFAVAEDHVLAADVEEHRAAEFAGEGPSFS